MKPCNDYKLTSFAGHNVFPLKFYLCFCNEKYVVCILSALFFWPDHWTNTCCSHPLAFAAEMEETDAAGVVRAARRKLNQELGISANQVISGKHSFDTKSFKVCRYWCAKYWKACPKCLNIRFLPRVFCIAFKVQVGTTFQKRGERMATRDKLLDDIIWWYFTFNSPIPYLQALYIILNYFLSLNFW